MVLRVRDVTGIDRLLVDTDLADELQTLHHGKVLFEPHKFGGHNGTRRILRVFQQLVDHAPLLRGRRRQNALDDGGGHFLDHVRGIVVVQLVQRFLQLRFREHPDQIFLLVRIQLDEDLGCQLLRQQPVDHQRLLFGQLVEEFTDIRRLRLAQKLPQRRVLFVVKKGERALDQPVLLLLDSFLQVELVQLLLLLVRYQADVFFFFHCV